MIPTIGQVMKEYPVIAGIERMKTGRPSTVSVNNVLYGAQRICDAAHVRPTDRIDTFSRPCIHAALATLTRDGIKRVSAKSYRDNLHALFARWSLPYYEDMGWEIPKIELPFLRLDPMRYRRPSSELLTRVKNWYNCLEGEWWFAATMMLEFAMRNGDVMRLKDENFILRTEKDAEGRRRERHFLSYTPHKTAHSSGRQVCWQIADSIWQRFYDYGGLSGLDVTTETFADLNHDLRELGFCGTKASYELRKICIDHIYQRFGAEVAVAISGDDIRTISHYYADPSCPTADKTILVIDLF